MTRRTRRLGETARLERGLYRLDLLTKLLDGFNESGTHTLEQWDLLTLTDLLQDIVIDIQAGQAACVREHNDLHSRLEQAEANAARRALTVVPS